MPRKKNKKVGNRGDGGDIKDFRKMLKKHGPDKTCEILEEELLQEEENKTTKD